MAISLDSGMAENVGRFLNETQLTDSSVPPPLGPTAHRESEFDFASSPQIDVQVHDDSVDSDVADANNNKYKQSLRYVPNMEFQAQETAEMSSMNGASVPNTFKHKSHPNARTKHHIGMPSLAENSHTSGHSAQSGHGAKTGLSEPRPVSPGIPEDPTAVPVKTSTFKGQNSDFLASFDHPNPSDQHTTPSWMPAGLEDKWEELSAKQPRAQQDPDSPDQRPNLASHPPSLDFLHASSNTFVHNPGASGPGPATPMWKKMSKEYQKRLSPGPESPLKHIFSTIDETHDSQRVSKSSASHKHGHSGYVSMSTVSTPVATRDSNRDSDLHLTQHQIHQLENMLEKAKDQPDDYQIKASPLKLFGAEYDTFTKAVLTKFVDKVRSTANSVQREPMPAIAELPAPKLNIKKFTRAGDYTDQDFMKNANDIFAHLQKKGYPEPENSTQLHKSGFISRSQTTATSTPKPEKINTEFRREPSEFYSYSTGSDSYSQPHQQTTSDALNEYTEIDKTNLAKSRRSSSSLGFSDDQADHASYTFDELSDFDSKSTERSSMGKGMGEGMIDASEKRSVQSPSPRSDVDESHSLPLFESSMSSVKQFMKDSGRQNNRGQNNGGQNNGEQNNGGQKYRGQKNDSRPGRKVFQNYQIEKEQPDLALSQNNSDGIVSNRRVSRPENAIKWKRPSQLRLSSTSSRANLPVDKEPRYMKGTVKPGVFPGQYGDMLFDSKQNRWVSNGKENDIGRSLDSIEDLISDVSDGHKSFLGQKNQASEKHPRGKDRRQLEVSFQVPASETSHTREENVPDVTSVSEVGNATFSQSNKELVSLITGSTDQIVWETITSIDLSDKNIDRVENLEQYLPAVKTIDLSGNKLKFVEGLPSALFELDVTKNNLSDMTSFDKFHDLQVVNASFNFFQSYSCLSNNVNLTKVNLMGNQITSLDGFPAIHALTSLNLSRNEIQGNISLDRLNLPNLKELNLAENEISGVRGIESLDNLRILNLNENRIVSLRCAGSHKRLKKLLVKFNDLRELSLECFPFLRILRLDGNSLVSVTGLTKLDFLHELSAKSQSSPKIVELFSNAAPDIASVDLSGNTSIISLLPSISVDAFYNVNQLNLSAVGLSSMPENFGEKFFNVRELNLSFNKLTDLRGLSNLKQLKRLQILSNNITKMEDVLTGLQKSRRTLKLLDMRLNIINFDFYPYVFSPQELEMAKNESDSKARESPIPIQALEDIESFTIHYNALNKSKQEWQARDGEFFTQMRKEGKDRKLKERLDYETILISFFLNLRDLDGSSIPSERRTGAFEKYSGR